MKLNVKIAGIFAVVAFALTAVAADAAFTRDLTIGSTGADVTELQTILEQGNYLTIPAGTSKGYFGALTKDAVMKWQAAVGLPSTGYFGPMSRAKIAAMPSTPGTDNGSDNGSDGLGSGEASLEAFDISSGDDSDVEEDSTAEVAEIEFDVEDGDISLNRVDLQLTGPSDKPWDAFEEVRLLVDGDEIASKDLSDEDEYLDEDEGTFRITGIDFEAMDGDTVTIVVEVTTQSNIDDDEIGTWTINTLDDGVRATDGEGIEQYIGDEDESVDFDVEEAGESDELNVSTSSEDPEATTLKVEDDKKSDVHSIFAFDIESEESDMEFDTIEIEVETGTADVNDVVAEFILEIDGEEFDDWSFVDDNNGASTTAVVEFDIDGDYTLDADSEVTAVLMVEFKAANGTNFASTGEEISASIADAAIDAEGADDILSDGVASGETHDLEIAGIIVDEEGFSDKGSDKNNDEGTSRDFTFSFTVEAFEEDYYVATSSIAIVVEGAGAASSTFTVSSTGDEDVDDVFTVEEGESETFTVVVTISNAVSGQYRVGLDSVQYTENSNGTSARSTKDVNISDFRTAYSTVNAN
jgi:peptidoglycan hydrolase-like protein with peptidoglycan-binding domain